MLCGPRLSFSAFAFSMPDIHTVLYILYVRAGTDWLVPKSPVAFHTLGLGLLPVCITPSTPTSILTGLYAPVYAHPLFCFFTSILGNGWDGPLQTPGCTESTSRCQLALAMGALAFEVPVLPVGPPNTPRSHLWARQLFGYRSCVGSRNAVE
jgi:hypothetical protein